MLELTIDLSLTTKNTNGGLDWSSNDVLLSGCEHLAPYFKDPSIGSNTSRIIRYHQTLYPDPYNTVGSNTQNTINIKPLHCCWIETGHK